MTRSIGFALLVVGLTSFGLRAEVRVAGDEAMKAVVQKTPPEYPAMAKQMRIGGHVEVDVTIDSEGNVQEVKVSSGNALLTPAVIGAVKKWKFTPFTENGTPARAVASLGFDFKL
jgi:periplasmic protein TonB